MDELSGKTACACLHVRKTGRQLSQMYDRYLRRVGIRSTQYGLLKCVEALPEPFISDIGRVLGMDQTTVTRNIEKLERAGLVEAKPYPGDPRKKMVCLSSSGRDKLAEARPLWEAAQKRVRDGMSEDELATLLRLLGKLASVTK